MLKKGTLLILSLTLLVVFMSATMVSEKPKGDEPKVEIDLSELRQYVQELRQNDDLKWGQKFALKIADKKLKKWEKKGVEKLMKKRRVRKALEKMGPEKTEGDSYVAAIVLCWLLGGLGIHRFYLGYTWQGVVQLLTAGGCGIWWLIDFIRIIVKSLEPASGSYS